MLWYDGLEEAIYSLEKHPDRCPLTPESNKYRHLLFGHRREQMSIQGTTGAGLRPFDGEQHYPLNSPASLLASGRVCPAYLFPAFLL